MLQKFEKFREIMCWVRTSKSISVAHSGVWGSNGSVPHMNKTVPYILMFLNTRILAGGVVLAVNGTSRRQSHSGGRISLLVRDIERVHYFLIIHYSAS